MATTARETTRRTSYRVRAQSVEACNCRHGCNCQFGGFPNDGKCEFIIAYEVAEGRFGNVDLGGVRAVVAGKYPGAIHQGNGHVVLFIDEKATDEQVEAFATILSGKMGGMPWEALAGTIGRLEGPVRTPIDFRAEGQHAAIRAGNFLELVTTPLVNPVTGAINEVHITYPNGGFFWNDGSIVTTSSMRAEHGAFRLEWPERFAAVAEVNWTNAA
ncbi:MAG TPA: DUF1326 domain-containing protein [Gemmatimonadales bacterium]|nr:DUF1326 domain-containing protein [Gemmatimonadales bacterium]